MKKLEVYNNGSGWRIVFPTRYNDQVLTSEEAKEWRDALDEAIERVNRQTPETRDTDLFCRRCGSILSDGTCFQCLGDRVWAELERTIILKSRQLGNTASVLRELERLTEGET